MKNTFFPVHPGDEDCLKSMIRNLYHFDHQQITVYTVDHGAPEVKPSISRLVGQRQHAPCSETDEGVTYSLRVGWLVT